MKHPGGRPAVMMPCGWCHEAQSLSGMRVHSTVCPRRGEPMETLEPGMVAIRVVVTDERNEQFERAAKFAEKSVSEWLRDLGAAAVAPPVSLESKGWAAPLPSGEYTVPIVGSDPPASVRIVEPPETKRTVSELAATIPGLMVGLRTSAVDRIEMNGEILFPVGTPEEPLSRLDVLYGKTVVKPEIFGRVHEVDGKTMHQTFGRQDDGSVKLISEYEVAEEETEPVRSWSEEFARCRKLGDFGAEAFGEATAHIKKWPNGFKTWNEPKQVAWLDEKHPLTDTQGGGR